MRVKLITICFLFIKEILAISFTSECTMDLITYWVKRETGQLSESEQRSVEDPLYNQLRDLGYPPSQADNLENPNWKGNGPRQSVYAWTYYLLQSTHKNPPYSLPSMRDRNWGWHALTWVDESNHYMIESGYIGGLAGAMKRFHPQRPKDLVDVKRGFALMYHLTTPLGAWPVLGDRSSDTSVMVYYYLYLGSWVLEDGTYRYLAEGVEDWVREAGYARGTKWTVGGNPDNLLRALRNHLPPSQIPTRESAYLLGHSYSPRDDRSFLNHPHKIVLRDGWGREAFYALFHVGTAGRGWHPNYCANGLFYLVWNGEFWMTGHGSDFMNLMAIITGNAGRLKLRDGVNCYRRNPENGLYYWGKCDVKFHNYPDYTFFTSRHPKGDLRQVIFRKGGYLAVFDNVVTSPREVRWWFRWDLAPQTNVEEGHIVQAKNGKYFTTKILNSAWISSVRLEEKDFRGKPGRYPASYPENTLSGLYKFLKASLRDKSIATILAPHYGGNAPQIQPGEVVRENGENAYPLAISAVVNGELIGSTFQEGTYIFRPGEIKTNARLISSRSINSVEEINVFGGNFVEIPLPSPPASISWVEHEQVPFWEMRAGRDEVRELTSWEYSNGHLRINYSGNGTIRLEGMGRIDKGGRKGKEINLNYPNPFNPECYIPINGKWKMENTRCKIYNILGQLVREIKISTFSSPISNSLYWDGRDSRGLEVPAGVYFYEVADEGIRKMVVLR